MLISDCVFDGNFALKYFVLREIINAEITENWDNFLQFIIIIITLFFVKSILFLDARIITQNPWNKESIERYTRRRKFVHIKFLSKIIMFLISLCLDYEMIKGDKQFNKMKGKEVTS